jgi:long-chain acyl-CoA synthetase
VGAELQEYFELVGVRVLETYGRPESGLVSIATPADADSRTAGRPLPGTDVVIADDGEILVSSAGLARARQAAPAGTADLLDGGWLHTGDVGVLDGEGRLRVLGGIAR